MEKNSKIFVTGHNGMVGSSVVRLLQKNGYTNIITRNKSEMNLINSEEVNNFFKVIQPEYVILSAAKVGGIQANIKQPVEFLYDNLMMQNNIIKSSYENNVKKLCFLGSSCIYPTSCPQPMKEEYLMTGLLEPTNEGYALAKITGLKLLEYYRKEYSFNGVSIMPCNLYGTNDHFDKNSHVLSSLIKKFVDAVDEGIDTVEVWGSGIARREFMHVDDCARAVLFVMENYNEGQFLNVGCGTDTSIKELAELIKKITDYKGNIKFDLSKPDGMLRKCLDVTKIENLGFKPTITLDEGIKRTLSEYKKLKGIK
jgi:GDP-L-fucose synthase